MQKSFNHSNHPEGDIINREFIVPGSQSTTVFLPVDHSLDDIALSVGHLVKLLSPGLVRPRRDHGLDTSLSAPEADAWVTYSPYLQLTAWANGSDPSAG